MSVRIDVHNHWLPEAYAEITQVPGYPYKVEIRPQNGMKKILFTGPQGVINSAPHLTAYWDWEQRFADMERRNLDMAVVSLHPFTFHYTEPAEYALQVHRMLNDELAGLVRRHPRRLRGLANVPLQDVGLAVEELARAVTDLNLCGVQVGSNVNGVYLGEEQFWPFWERVQELGALVLIHPRAVAGADRMGQYYLRNLIGNLLDTSICAASMIFGGVFDKYPGLRVCLSHGGGQLPYLIGRLDHGWKVRPECRTVSRPPQEYLRHFYYDTITHSPEALAYLLARVGADRVVIGTDYPFDMEDDSPLDKLNQLPLSARERNMVCGDNLAWLL